jgi:hypothetical protein
MRRFKTDEQPATRYSHPSANPLAPGMQQATDAVHGRFRPQFSHADPCPFPSVVRLESLTYLPPSAVRLQSQTYLPPSGWKA